ncbi:MAG: alpha-1,2-fucosyltransferase [Bacteroidota bacterium]
MRLKGGMGNQMFQYAAGLALASQANTGLTLDLSNLLYRNKGKDFVYRKYDLDVFQVDPPFLTRPEVLAPLMDLRIKPLSKIVRRLSTRGLPVVREQHFHYDPRLLPTSRPGVIYDGWFQCPEYFSEVEQEVRAAFRFRHEVIPASQALLARIKQTNAICLNVRRTDFLKVDTLNATDLDYFLRGAAYLAERVDNPHFFVFSDDVAWCRESIKLPHPTEFVDHAHKGFKFGNYLQLMTNCKHFLIPNSSFAWWATWLNTNPEKLVVAPNRWFTDPTIDTRDLVPKTWVRL